MGIIEQLQDEMKQLKAEVIDLRICMGLMTADNKGEYVVKKEKSQQEIRDEIIEKCKNDIEELKTGRAISGKKGYAFNKSIYINRVEFKVNKEKRTVVALLIKPYIVGDGDVVSKGIAKCDPNDCFNIHIGKSIALHKSLGLNVPTEYLHVQNPTEVRVGDITGYPFDENDNSVSEVVEIEDGEVIYKDRGFDPIEYLFGCDDKEFILRIVDDSREK